MKKFLVYLLVSLLSLGSLNAYAGKKTQNKASKQEQSKNQPTKEETVKFIIETMKANYFRVRGDNNSYKPGRNYTNVNYQDDTLQFKENLSSINTPNYSSSTVAFQVKDISPETEWLYFEDGYGSGNVYVIRLKCTIGACMSNDWNNTSRNESGHDSNTKYDLYFDDRDESQRLEKAFNHLIKISGGKEKLF